MTLRRFLILALLPLTLVGCGLIYKQNIQQGNALEQDELDELYIGMNERQVLFVLGTPSVRDPFHQERWDYVQTFSRRGGDMVQRTVTLRFEDGLLARIEGQEDPFADPTKGGSGGTGTVASFVKEPQTSGSSPQDVSIEEAQEEVLGAKPDIDTVDDRSSSERDYKKDQDVLDQTPKDGGPMGPDIDG